MNRLIYGASLPTKETDSKSRYHYVYRITNVKLNKHYYGKRTTKHNPYNDLGVIYFSSGDPLFVQDQKDNPKDFKYKIIKMFDTSQDAINYEIELHNKFSVNTHEMFYNKVKQSATGFSTEGLASVIDEEGNVLLVIATEAHKYKGVSFGFKWYTNGNGEFKTCKPGSEPKGWVLGTPSKGKPYHNPETRQMKFVINPEDVPEGWVKGALPMLGPSPTIGRLWVHVIEDGVAIKRRVLKEDLTDDMILGTGAASSMVGMKHIHNPVTGHRTSILESEPIPDGYIRGTGASGKVGKILYHDPIKNEQCWVIKGEDPPPGFIKGALPQRCSHCRGKLWYHNPVTGHRVHTSKGCPDGYVSGSGYKANQNKKVYTNKDGHTLYLNPDDVVPDGYIKGWGSKTSLCYNIITNTSGRCMPDLHNIFYNQKSIVYKVTLSNEIVYIRGIEDASYWGKKLKVKITPFSAFLRGEPIPRVPPILDGATVEKIPFLEAVKLGLVYSLIP